MQTDRAGVALLLSGILGLWPCLLRAEQPLSAIDWLSKSITAPPGTVLTPAAVGKFDPNDNTSRVPETVTTSVIGAGSLDALGLLSTKVTGLPQNLWGLGRTTEIAATITVERGDTLPSLQALFLTLLLAEADAPADSDGTGVLLLARIDKLLAIGALDQASALLIAAGDGTADLFRRSFDVALLQGSEDAACEKMQAAPELAPTFPARIFCLARAGDWNAAALSLQTAKALDQITGTENELLSRFLEPELSDGSAPLPVPEKPSPLVLRMYEAIGEPLNTPALPIAFSHADLGNRSGWKARIEAAERLTRAGVIPANILLGLYTEREPAASGGVWDRVDAFQDFDSAIRAGKADQVATTLPVVWARLSSAELEVPFATLYGKDLLSMKLTGPVGTLAFRIALLSDQYERAAQGREPADAAEAFLIAVAKGDLKGVTPPDALARAIAPAFLRPDPGEEVMGMLDQGRIGETLLYAIDRIQNGATGDLMDVTEGLSVLRGLGLEDVARRTALELLLLERRG
jgi:hypothetical protein